ncbi:MAG: nuclear transport factor 2 family protein [Methylobacillus sp.]|jgi:ketosteroid isomerase-like protein|nr:nuclear transport factor 2 family protein [Methylobacillus sp.]
MTFAINLKRLLLLCAMLLVACSRSDPQVALDNAVEDLQTALENKDTSAVMSLLHPDFTAQYPDDGREWAKRTMTLMFLRYKNIRVIALVQSNRIDPYMSGHAFTVAKVTLTGAEGLIPDSARQYHVNLEWSQLDKEWKLIRLQWE